MLISCLRNFTPISWSHVLWLLDLKKFHIDFTCFDHVKRRTTFHVVISHGHFTYISHTFHMAPSSSESYLLLYVYSWYTKFDFTAGRIPPFYWEPCDWCGLMSVDIPATNHSKCLETAKLLFTVPKEPSTKSVWTCDI